MGGGREVSVIVKRYSGMSTFHWKRVLRASLTMARLRLGPTVYSYDSSQKWIAYEKLDGTFDVDSIIPFKEVEKPKIMRMIRDMVYRMHAAGYGHGDLHSGNIGYKYNKLGTLSLYFIDHDSMYKIEDNWTKWLREFARKGYDWFDEHTIAETSFDEFVDNDYNTAFSHEWFED